MYPTIIITAATHLSPRGSSLFTNRVTMYDIYEDEQDDIRKVPWTLEVVGSNHLDLEKFIQKEERGYRNDRNLHSKDSFA